MNDALFPLPGSTARLSEDGAYRYELSRRWAKGPMATFIMLNPSKADATLDDQTIRRCRSLARSWGLGGLWVVNLFALRSTDPEALRRTEDPVGPENDDAIHDAVVRSRIVVVAWGAHPFAKERATHVLGMLDEVGRAPRCLGSTKEGHPRHPLRVRTDVELCLYVKGVHGKPGASAWSNIATDEDFNRRAGG